MPRDSPDAVLAFLRRVDWLGPLNDDAVTFLAAGEYHENFLVRTPAGRRVVLRVNHGSQIGQARQIEYERAVLLALRHSGVTPLPFQVDPAPAELAGGALCLEFLPGRPLRYETDAPLAAAIFARVHVQPVPEASDPPLLHQPAPLRDIADECDALLARAPCPPGHRWHAARRRLLAHGETVRRLHEEQGALLAGEAPALVNSEVNAGNFLIQDSPRKAALIDWEKAVVSARYQDLGHFLAPTTTLWKTDYRFSPEARLAFLAAYGRELREAGGPDIPLEELDRKTRLLERAVLLRGLSWCLMAWEAHAQGSGMGHPETLRVIERYLENVEELLA